MAKIISVVGGRPQFIKEAITGKELRKLHKEILVHTGQHYDVELSRKLFQQLDIIEPKYNLGVGSGSHARQTAAVMIGMEEIIEKERPDIVLVYGDMNSTMGACIASAKLNVPIAHVEAGARMRVFDMPEEQNRIVSDHLSKWNFALNEECYENLVNEGLEKTAIKVGDVMYDALVYFREISLKETKENYWKRLDFIFDRSDVSPEQWYLATIHRPENTDVLETLEIILSALEKLPHIVLMPVHPRIHSKVKKKKKKHHYRNIIFVKPVGYLESIYYLSNAVGVITDSGGLQREAYWAKTPCTAVLRAVDDKRMLKGNCLIMAKVEQDDILDKVINSKRNNLAYDFSEYGDGHACRLIAETLMK